ncbi:MAG: DUF167 domain-containing protein [Polyangiaceae bacterium]
MAARITVKAKPRASRRGVAVKDGVVIVSVTAPPVDGRANEEIVEVVADHLGVRRADIAFVSGETAKVKILEIRSLDQVTVDGRLGLRPASA